MYKVLDNTSLEKAIKDLGYEPEIRKQKIYESFIELELDDEETMLNDTCAGPLLEDIYDSIVTGLPIEGMYYPETFLAEYALILNEAGFYVNRQSNSKYCYRFFIGGIHNNNTAYQLICHTLLRYLYLPGYDHIPAHIVNLSRNRKELGLDAMQCIILGHYGDPSYRNGDGYYGLLSGSSRTISLNTVKIKEQLKTAYEVHTVFLDSGGVEGWSKLGPYLTQPPHLTHREKEWSIKHAMFKEGASGIQKLINLFKDSIQKYEILDWENDERIKKRTTRIKQADQKKAAAISSTESIRSRT